jgi:hypothetical protein
VPEYDLRDGVVVVDPQPDAQATIPAGFSVWRIAVTREMSWTPKQFRAGAGPLVAEMLRRSFQPNATTIWPYGELASERAWGSGDARPLSLIEEAYGPYQGAAMSVPQGEIQTRCWYSEDDRRAHCLEQPSGGDPCWYSLWWIYWRREQTTGPWPMMRSDTSGKVLAIADVISKPKSIRWDPPDKSPTGVVRETIVRAIQQTQADVKDVVGKAKRSPWPYLIGAGIAAYLLRPLLRRL